MSHNRPRVDVLALGGTIAMSTTRSGGVTPALTAKDLLDSVPGLVDAGIDIRAAQVRQLPGASLTVPDIVEVARDIAERFADGAAGVVVVQGTDTIEETSYLLDLLHPGEQPIVVTGAMRNPTQPGADGPANLNAAIRVAAHPTARGRGCMVVMNDQIHAATQVVKTHTSSTAAFCSPTTGPLGGLAEQQPHLYAPPVSRFTLPAPSAGALPQVGLYTVTIGDDGTAIPAIGAAYQGMVVAAMGVGHVPAGLVEPLASLAASMPVVLASRTGAGTVHTATYGFPGSETDLLARGLINAGYLHPYKARLLLSTLLATGHDRDAIGSAFASAQPHQ